MDEKTLTQLLNAKAFNHPTRSFNIIETHISWVILTGDYAYKIKKPVKFDFVDFSTLEKRRFFCEEELRLNQILCPDLYISVCPIIQKEEPYECEIRHEFEIGHPRVGGDPGASASIINTGSPLTRGRQDSNIFHSEINSPKIIDYAIKMKQFNQHALLSSTLKDGSHLNSRVGNDDEQSCLIMEDIAKQLANFHKKTTIAPSDSSYGNLSSISEPMLDNFNTIESLVSTDKNLSDLKSFCLSELQRLSLLFLERKEREFIRDCHGDLHLGNLFLDKTISEHVCIFDRIEFNLNFRFIDVINDIAFLFMDLKSQTHHNEAYCFLNSYLEITGDYEGLQILNFYAIYRALIRAKVALLESTLKTNKNFNRNLHTALQIMQFQQMNKPTLIMMHGISGSGKTSLAKQLAPLIPAILIRSDIERKRLFFEIQKKNLNSLAKEELTFELYGDEMSQMTFSKLLHLAKIIINSGNSVIVDATFLRVSHREPFMALSKKLNCPFKIIHCEAPIELVHQRVAERFNLKQDASDADSRVVELQLVEYEGLTEDEKKQSIIVSTTTHINIKYIVTQLR